MQGSGKMLTEGTNRSTTDQTNNKQFENDTKKFNSLLNHSLGRQVHKYIGVYQTMVLKKVTLSYQMGVVLCNGKKTSHLNQSLEWLEKTLGESLKLVVGHNNKPVLLTRSQ